MMLAGVETDDEDAWPTGDARVADVGEMDHPAIRAPRLAIARLHRPGTNVGQ
jgi:hypothetical protein